VNAPPRTAWWARRLKPFAHPLRWWLLWWLMVVAVVVASLLPAGDMPALPAGSDKLEHLLAYAVLMAGAVQVYARRASLVGAALGLVLLGVLIELWQGQMGLGRQADAYDVLADGLGVLLGAATSLTGARDALLRLDQRGMPRRDAS
jgi:VanZ family protein